MGMTLVDIDAFLPVLSERDNGSVIDVTTGEAIDLDDKAAVKRACGAVIDAYALAATKADALRLAIDAKRAPLVKAAMDAVEAELTNDLDYQAALIDQAEAVAARDAILEGLNGALGGRTGDHAISLDTGGALVTWGKARETWSLAHPASWYTSNAAKRSLAHAIAGATDIDAIVDTVIDWLDPTAKLSDLPPVRVTLRGEK